MRSLYWQRNERIEIKLFGVKLKKIGALLIVLNEIVKIIFISYIYNLLLYNTISCFPNSSVQDMYTITKFNMRKMIRNIN